MRKVVAVDVDLTVVDSLKPWMDWFRQFTEETVKNESRDYNLVPEMKAILDRAGRQDIDPLDYWRTDLYDGLFPVEGAYEALKRVKANDDILLFVSHCFPEHEASKIRFLKKFFPFYDAFISTEQKHFIAYDVLVDDKVAHAHLGHQFRPCANHIIYTGVRADGHVMDRVGYDKLEDWNQFSY